MNKKNEHLVMNSNKKAAFDAVWNGDTTFVKEILTNGGDVNWRIEDNIAMLHCAVKNRDVGMVRFLISMEADVGVRAGNSGKTPLHYAAMEGHMEIIALLLEMEGCDINERDNNGLTPLHYASLKGKYDTVLYIISKWADAHAVEYDQGLKAVHLAAYEGHTDIVQAFLDNGVDIDVVDNKGRTMLHFSAIEGNLDITKFLLDRKANIEAADKFTQKVIHICATYNSVPIAKELICRGADINSRDGQGYTPLHVAAEDGSFEMAQLLVEKGANLNIENDEGQTAIDLALDLSRIEIASLFAKNITQQLPTKYQDVLRILKRLLELQNDKLGNDHKDTLETQRNIALIAHKQELWKQVFGTFENDPNKLENITYQFDNLCTKYLVGKTYLTQSKFKDAKMIFKEVHDAWQVSLGARHPLTLDVLGDLASAHLQRCEYHEASEIYEDLLMKRKSTFSDANHPDILQTMKDLAFALANKGENKKAIVLFKQLLAKYKASLGDDHTDTQLIAFHIDIVEKKMENIPGNGACRMHLVYFCLVLFIFVWCFFIKQNNKQYVYNKVFEVLFTK